MFCADKSVKHMALHVPSLCTRIEIVDRGKLCSSNIHSGHKTWWAGSTFHQLSRLTQFLCSSQSDVISKASREGHQRHVHIVHITDTGEMGHTR